MVKQYAAARQQEVVIVGMAVRTRDERHNQWGQLGQPLRSLLALGGSARLRLMKSSYGLLETGCCSCWLLATSAAAIRSFPVVRRAPGDPQACCSASFGSILLLAGPPQHSLEAAAAAVVGRTPRGEGSFGCVLVAADASPAGTATVVFIFLRKPCCCCDCCDGDCGGDFSFGEVDLLRRRLSSQGSALVVVWLSVFGDGGAADDPLPSLRIDVPSPPPPSLLPLVVPSDVRTDHMLFGSESIDREEVRRTPPGVVGCDGTCESGGGCALDAKAEFAPPLEADERDSLFGDESLDCNAPGDFGVGEEDDPAEAIADAASPNEPNRRNRPGELCATAFITPSTIPAAFPAALLMILCSRFFSLSFSHSCRLRNICTSRSRYLAP